MATALGADEIKRKGTELARMRQRRDEMDGVLKARRLALETALAPMVRDLKLTEIDAATLEAQLRDLLTELFAETGSKQFAFGCSVREVDDFDFDPAEAVRYCVAHGLTECLKLDTAAFKASLRLAPPPFVTVRKRVTTAIPTDLAAAGVLT